MITKIPNKIESDSAVTLETKGNQHREVNSQQYENTKKQGERTDLELSDTTVNKLAKRD
jgi:hypothetical protein